MLSKLLLYEIFYSVHLRHEVFQSISELRIETSCACLSRKSTCSYNVLIVLQCMVYRWRVANFARIGKTRRCDYYIRPARWLFKSIHIMQYCKVWLICAYSLRRVAVSQRLRDGIYRLLMKIWISLQWDWARVAR